MLRGHFCIMKSLALLFVLFAGSLFAEDRPSVQVIQVFDVKNETISGAKVELAGTGRIYYTNLKGQCFIPATLLKASKEIIIECISYKSQTVKTFENSSKIILEFR
jgi:hypothetical protein